jgi:hypothetical protein
MLEKKFNESLHPSIYKIEEDSGILKLGYDIDACLSRVMLLHRAIVFISAQTDQTTMMMPISFWNMQVYNI